MLRRLRTAILACFSVAALPGAFPVSVAPNGSYDIAAGNWRFGGETGAPVSNLTITDGTDAIGPYRETSFDYSLDAPRHAAIRAYTNRSAVMFSVQYLAAAANVAPFPSFRRYPDLPNHLTFAGYFAIPSFPGLGPEGPWTFFDNSARTFVISPAANYLVARTTRSTAGEISTGIAAEIQTLPAGFSHQTLLVVEDGVNRAFETWGRALTDLSGKTLAANDSSTVLNRIGYWTDAGATYYYRTEPSGPAESVASSRLSVSLLRKLSLNGQMPKALARRLLYRNSDVPIVPIDQSFLNDARNLKAPLGRMVRQRGRHLRLLRRAGAVHRRPVRVPAEPGHSAGHARALDRRLQSGPAAIPDVRQCLHRSELLESRGRLSGRLGCDRV